MIDFKEEVLKHKDEMLKDLKDLCLIPSTLDKSTAKENQPFGENNRKALDLMLSIGQRDGFVLLILVKEKTALVFLDT